MSTVEIPENVWNLLKVNNKNTRATSLTSFWYLSLTLNRFHKWFVCFHFWLWTSNILVYWNLKHLFSTMVQWTYSKLIMTEKHFSKLVLVSLFLVGYAHQLLPHMELTQKYTSHRYLAYFVIFIPHTGISKIDKICSGVYSVKDI